MTLAAAFGTVSNEVLTARQTRALLALVAGRKVPAAAAAANVGERTLRRWLTNAEFKAELRRAQEAVLETAAGKLLAASEAAADELIGLMKSKKGDVRVKKSACKDVLELARSVQDADLEERLSMLERAVKARR